MCWSEGSVGSFVAVAGVCVLRLFEALTWVDEEGGWQNSSNRSAW